MRFCVRLVPRVRRILFPMNQRRFGFRASRALSRRLVSVYFRRCPLAFPCVPSLPFGLTRVRTTSSTHSPASALHFAPYGGLKALFEFTLPPIRVSSYVFSPPHRHSCPFSSPLHLLSFGHSQDPPQTTFPFRFRRKTLYDFIFFSCLRRRRHPLPFLSCWPSHRPATFRFSPKRLRDASALAGRHHIQTCNVSPFFPRN